MAAPLRVPPDQIKLFLSPVDEATLAARKVNGVSLAGLVPRLPKSSDIRDTLLIELTKYRDAELLFFFWFGHGVIRMNHNTYLFYADASPDDPHCCDMDSLVTSLRSSRFLSFRLQIFVIDACQDYVEYDEVLDASLTNQPFPAIKPPLSRSQLQLYSTFPGSRAADQPETGEASFCQRLLEALKTEPDEPWPPRMDKVVWSVKSLFHSDRPGEQPEQMPVVRYVSWETDSFDYLREWGPRVLNPRAAKERSVPDGRRDRLTDCLRRVAALQEPKRKTVLQCLPQADDVLCAFAQNSDFYKSLAEVSTKRPGGLEALTEALHEFGPDDPALKALDEALDEILPQIILWGETGELKQLLRGQELPKGVKAEVKANASRSGPKDWVACQRRTALFDDLDRLARCNLALEGGRRQALLGFVEDLLPGLGAEVRGSMDDWLNRVSGRLNVPRTARAEPPAPAPAGAPAALLVHLVPKGALRDPRGNLVYELQGWLVREKKTKCVTPRLSPAAFDDLHQVVGAMLDTAFELLDYEPVDLTVQFFVRREILIGLEGGDLDRLMIDVGTVMKKPLGVKHTVVLRSAERAYEVSKRSWPAWWECWKARPISPQLATEANIFRLGGVEGNLDIRLEKAGPVPVCLAPSLAGEPGKDAEALLRAGLILDAGTPIGVWFRQPVKDPVCAEIEMKLNQLVCDQLLDDLPRRVRKARASVWEQTPEAARFAGRAPEGNPVVLLWDDPTLLPPDARKPGAFRQPQ